MRRAITAVTLGGFLLAGTACDRTASETATPPPAPPASIPVTSAAPDYSASTRLVCGKLRDIFAHGFDSFGTELGRMVAFKEAKLKDEAAAARKAAAKRLRTVAASIRKESAAAQDPAISAAGDVSATKIEKSAGDAAFYAKIKTRKDLDRAIDDQMGAWLSPVAGYCP